MTPHGECGSRDFPPRSYFNWTVCTSALTLRIQYPCLLPRLGHLQVTLPASDSVMGPGMYSDGNPGTRWFDFSNAPDVEGFDATSCTLDITWGGSDAFHFYQCTQRLSGR